MKKTTRLALAVTASLFAMSTAGAQTFTGFTNGCFYLDINAQCSPASTSSNTVVSLSNLDYRNSTFNGSAVGGLFGLGGSAANPNVGNLGSFSLANGTNNYGLSSFVLRVNFTAPAGTNPGNQTFAADLVGTVQGNSGQVFVNFGAAQNFTFDGGAFSLTVNDLTVNTGETVALTGTIAVTQSTVPEPGTYALLAAGLAGLGVVARRRRTA